MTSGIIRVILDDFTAFNDGTNFLGPDHSLRPGHLAQCVGQEQDALACRGPDLQQDVRKVWHVHGLL